MTSSSVPATTCLNGWAPSTSRHWHGAGWPYLPAATGGRHDLIPQERIDRINGVSRDPETSSDAVPEADAALEAHAVLAEAPEEVPVAVG